MTMKTVRKPARKAPAKQKRAVKKPAVKKAARKRTPAKKPSPSKQKAFLAAYAACGNISDAARKAKCSRFAHYKWMQDAAYAEAFAKAHEQAGEALATKRAVQKVVRKRAPVAKRSPLKQKAFLAAYAECGCISYAARMAKCNRRTHYKWMQGAAYAEAYAEAHEEACDALESEAWRRAVKGVPKPVYYKGKIVGTEREYSDILLMFLMKGWMPEKYRDNVKTEHDDSAELLKRLAEGRARVAAARAADAERWDGTVQ